MTIDLTIRGNVIFGNQVCRDATLLIDGGRVAGIVADGVPVGARRCIDATGKWVLPGVLDAHVHALSHPSEGFCHTTRSAAAGGVTTIMDMPLDAPRGIADPEAFTRKLARARSESVVDFALLGCVKNETLEHIPALCELGVCGFKMSLFHTEPDRFPRIHDGHLLEAFERIAPTGLTAGVHAENTEIIERRIALCRQAGRTDPRSHGYTRPEVSETESVLKALEFARATGVRLHLYHISSDRSIALARMFADQGTRVTAETCPHYLTFTEDDLDRLGARVRINPPVRSAAVREALWRQLADGRIDIVTSDHIPWPPEWKTRASIFDNASGAPGIETLLPLVYDGGVARGRFDVLRLVEILCARPAQIFGLWPRKGVLAPGSDADVVIFDPAADWTVDGPSLQSPKGWSPYQDMRLAGRIDTTLVRGRVVYENGTVAEQPGQGQFIRP